MAAVYAIECTINGFVYVGCTRTNPARRMREMRSYLKRRIHSSERMVEDWHNYGDDRFTMRVLEQLPDDASLNVRREAELRWMRYFLDQDRLYNVHLVSFGPCGDWKEKSHTTAANLKRSLTQRGRPKPVGHGAKISATKRALGQRPSAEAVRAGNRAALLKRWGTVPRD